MLGHLIFFFGGGGVGRKDLCWYQNIYIFYDNIHLLFCQPHDWQQ